MRKLNIDNNGSAIPIILFIMGIIGAGALYTLLIVEVGQPLFEHYIPSGDIRTFVMMVIYGIPMFILVVGVIALIKTGLKQEAVY